MFAEEHEVAGSDVAGIAAAASGRWDKGEEHYQTALPPARELLTEAIAAYRQIGMPKHVGMAQALLSQL